MRYLGQQLKKQENQYLTCLVDLLFVCTGVFTFGKWYFIHKPPFCTLNHRTHKHFVCSVAVIHFLKNNHTQTLNYYGGVNFKNWNIQNVCTLLFTVESWVISLWTVWLFVLTWYLKECKREMSKNVSYTCIIVVAALKEALYFVAVNIVFIVLIL